MLQTHTCECKSKWELHKNIEMGESHTCDKL